MSTLRIARAVIQGGEDGVEVLYDQEIEDAEDMDEAVQIAWRMGHEEGRDVRLSVRAWTRIGPQASTLRWFDLYDSTNASNLDARSVNEIREMVNAVERKATEAPLDG